MNTSIIDKIVRISWLFVLFFSLTGLLFSYTGQASMMLPFSLKDLTQQAELIAKVKELDAQSRWSPGKKMIFTYFDLKVQETLKGKVEKEKICLKQMGGIVGDHGMMVSGNPKLKKGEETLLFLQLHKNQKGEKCYYVLGMAQGKYSLITTKINQIPVLEAFRAMDGLNLIQKGKTTLPANRISYQELKAKILKIKSHQK